MRLSAILQSFQLLGNFAASSLVEREEERRGYPGDEAVELRCAAFVLRGRRWVGREGRERGRWTVRVAVRHVEFDAFRKGSVYGVWRRAKLLVEVFLNSGEVKEDIRLDERHVVVTD